MIKKMLILVASCALLLGCAGVDSGKTSAGKHRKIALHGYVYSKVKTLEETVKEAKALARTASYARARRKSAENSRT